MGKEESPQLLFMIACCLNWKRHNKIITINNHDWWEQRCDPTQFQLSTHAQTIDNMRLSNKIIEFMSKLVGKYVFGKREKLGPNLE